MCDLINRLRDVVKWDSMSSLHRMLMTTAADRIEELENPPPTSPDRAFDHKCGTPGGRSFHLNDDDLYQCDRCEEVFPAATEAPSNGPD